MATRCHREAGMKGVSPGDVYGNGTLYDTIVRDVCMCVCRHTFVKPIGCSTENMDPNVNYGL